MAKTEDNKSIKNSGPLKAQVDSQRKANESEMDIYEQALSKYNLDVNEQEVKDAVKKIIEEKVPENDTVEVKKFLFSCVELTSLNTTDNDEKILAMTEKVNQFFISFPNLPHVATMCVYPNFASIIRNSLEIDDVEIAVVAGSFPTSQTFPEIKIAETALAIRDGATNVDIVLSVGKFLNGDYEGMCDEIGEIKETCGEVPLKVILENCLLGGLSNVKKASILAMYAGADYIKTSTGKDKGGATPEDVYVMCQAIKEYYDETGIQIGLKPAGGIHSVMDVVVFYTIVKEVLGEKWLTNYFFRIGTSSLANKLLSEIEGKEIKFF